MQFGPYTVERAVEQLGSVTVYAAKDTASGRTVLLSVFKPESIEAAQRWTDRLLTLRRLQHNGIVAAAEGGITPSGEQYAVTAFLPLLLGRNRVLNIQDALEVSRQIAAALDFAHRQGIVHGAIRPAFVGQVSPKQIALRGWELTGASDSHTSDIAELGQFVHRALTGQTIADKKLSPRLPAPIANVLRDTLPSGSGYKSAGAFHEAFAAAVRSVPAKQRQQVLVDLPQAQLNSPRKVGLVTVLAFVLVAITVAAAATLLLLNQAAQAQVPVATVAQIPTDTPTINTTAVYDSSDATAIPSNTPSPSPTEVPDSPTPLSVVTATTAPFTPGPTSTATQTPSPTATETATPLPPPPKPCVSLVGDSVTHGGITYEIPDIGYIVGLTHPLAEFLNQELQAQNINNLVAYDRGASNTGINSYNHFSYFKTQAYFNLLGDHCKFTVIMPWYNDITPSIAQSDAAPQHVRAIIGLTRTLVAANPAGRIIVLNYFEGAVAPFAAQTWAPGFTEHNRELYNHEIQNSCENGSLKSIEQVSCFNTNDAFEGMGSSYVIGLASRDEIVRNLVQPLSDLQQGWFDEYFALRPNGLLQGDGIHLNSAGKTALADYIIKITQGLPDLPTAASQPGF